MIILQFLALLIPPLSSGDGGSSSTGVLFYANLPNGGEITADAQAARFGIPDYDGGRKGRIRAAPLGNENGCEPIDTSVWDDWTAEENTILMIHRGECKFVVKVQNAEDAKMAGVVVIDYEDSGDNVVDMSPPEDFDHQTITIGACAIPYSTWIRVRNAMTNDAGQPVPLRGGIDWDVPRTDGRAKLELFTSSQDAEDMMFKRNFREIARILNQEDKFIFEPLYFIENGTHYGCAHSQICGDQCANNGLYCSVDPDHAIFFGISGYDVVRENLAQMCMFKFTQEDERAVSHERTEDIWWEYVANFDEECLVEASENGDHKFHETCSTLVLGKTEKAFGFPKNSMVTYVHNCIEESGQIDKARETVNTMLQEAMEKRESRHIKLLPSFAINGFELHGSWHCPEHPNVDNCNIFRALCASFMEDQKPQVCGNDPGCPAGVYRDPCGECTSSSPISSTSPGCDEYLNSKSASQGSVIAISVIICLITVGLGVLIYVLFKKNEHTEAVLSETKKYITLEDGMDPNNIQLGGRPGYGKVSNTGLQANSV